LTVISFTPRPQLMMKPKLPLARAIYLMICVQLVVDWTNDGYDSNKLSLCVVNE
jgi:hypothetical protein